MGLALGRDVCLGLTAFDLIESIAVSRIGQCSLNGVPSIVRPRLTPHWSFRYSRLRHFANDDDLVRIVDQKLTVGPMHQFAPVSMIRPCGSVKFR